MGPLQRKDHLTTKLHSGASRHSPKTKLTGLSTGSPSKKESSDDHSQSECQPALAKQQTNRALIWGPLPKGSSHDDSQSGCRLALAEKQNKQGGSRLGAPPSPSTRTPYRPQSWPRLTPAGPKQIALGPQHSRTVERRRIHNNPTRLSSGSPSQRKDHLMMTLTHNSGANSHSPTNQTTPPRTKQRVSSQTTKTERQPQGWPKPKPVSPPPIAPGLPGAPEVYTIQEVAALLRISDCSVRRLEWRGILQRVPKIGLIRITAKSVAILMEGGAK